MRVRDRGSATNVNESGRCCWKILDRTGSPGRGFSPKHSRPEWDSQSRGRVASEGLPVLLDTIFPTASWDYGRLPRPRRWLRGRARSSAWLLAPRWQVAAGWQPTAPKCAVLRLAESISAELKGNGIHVNCVLPGTIDTP
jgi:hypothetical protein